MAQKKKGTTKKPAPKATRTIKKPTQPKAKRASPAPYFVGFVAIFIILTFFLPETGVLGLATKQVLKGLFGAGYYYLPFIMLFISLKWRGSDEDGSVGFKVLLSCVNFLFILCLIHLFTAEKPDEFGIQLYSLGQETKGAGLIGGNFGAFCHKALGSIATGIISVLVTAVTIVFLFGSTPRATLKRIARYLKSIDLSSAELDEENEYEDNELSVDTTAVIPAKKERKRTSSLPVTPIIVEDLTKSAEEKSFDMPVEAEPVKVAGRDIFDGERVNRDSPFSKKAHPKEPAKEIFAEEASDESDAGGESPRGGEPSVELSSASEMLSGEAKDDDIIVDTEEINSDERSEPLYVFPPTSLLSEGEKDGYSMSKSDVSSTSTRLEEIMNSFGVKAKVISYSCGPTVTRYELVPETGVKVKQIMNLSDDIALHLAATSIRIENIPGKAAIGVEIPNKSLVTVHLRDLIEAPAFKDSKSPLLAALGLGVAGNPIYVDIEKMPHLLIAGATGMGKSVCINSLLISLLYRSSPKNLKLILVDPKRIELSDYNDIPHLLVPVINEPKKAAGTLNWACIEMEKRYQLIQEVGARNLTEYNQIIQDEPEREHQPYIVIVIDELADLMMTAPDDVESSICRLAQKARAAGMHLIIGTQRPSVDVITGLIKANVPSRIACTVASQIDSRTILDMGGAEKLMGRGDMLYSPVGSIKPMRVQGAFVDGKTEVIPVTQFIKEAAKAEYNDEVMNMIEQEAKLCGVKPSKRAQMLEEGDSDGKLDPKLIEALEVAMDAGNISKTMLQSRLSVGYARADRIIDKLEQYGYISAFDTATKKRSVLISHEEFLELKLGQKTASSEAKEEQDASV